MSVLHNPGPGEILDRLTILALKITYGRLAGKDCTHWETERTALAAILPTCQVKCIAGGGNILELAAVNGALWQAEDQIRAYRAEPPALRQGHDRIVDCAFRIQSLNDRRAELVTLINVNAGVHRSAEKG